MRSQVRIEVDEPFELVRRAEGAVAVVGELVPGDSSEEELVVIPEEGTRLAGRLLTRIVATPRYVGHSFVELRDRKVIVNARAAAADGGDEIHFLGAVALTE
jgi:hypothetical protein